MNTAFNDGMNGVERHYESALRSALSEIGASEAINRLLSKYGNIRTRAIYACELERNEIFARYAPAMEEFGDDEGRTVYIKDNRAKRRIAAVTLQGKELHCDVDDSNDCVHVGFAYSLPKVYKVMGELGIKPPIIKRA